MTRVSVYTVESIGKIIDPEVNYQSNHGDSLSAKFVETFSLSEKQFRVIYGVFYRDYLKLAQTLSAIQ